MTADQTAVLPAPLRLGLRLLIPLAVVAAAVWPHRDRLPLPAIRLHAPEFWRHAAAPPAVQIHLAGVAVALGVGVVLLVGVKGSRLHRVLGWIWVAAMMTGAVSSLFIRIINHGAFSYIHLLSGWTILALPMAVYAARTHRVGVHARTMTGLFTGGLILAGLLAFLPGRLMWRMFLG
jgi:uncharacterized membrane protein